MPVTPPTVGEVDSLQLAPSGSRGPSRCGCNAVSSPVAVPADEVAIACRQISPSNDAAAQPVEPVQWADLSDAEVVASEGTQVSPDQRALEPNQRAIEPRSAVVEAQARLDEFYAQGPLAAWVRAHYAS